MIGIGGLLFLVTNYYFAPIFAHVTNQKELETLVINENESPPRIESSFTMH